MNNDWLWVSTRRKQKKKTNSKLQLIDWLAVFSSQRKIEPTETLNNSRNKNATHFSNAYITSFTFYSANGRYQPNCVFDFSTERGRAEKKFYSHRLMRWFDFSFLSLLLSIVHHHLKLNEREVLYNETKCWDFRQVKRTIRMYITAYRWREKEKKKDFFRKDSLARCLLLLTIFIWYYDIIDWTKFIGSLTFEVIL